LHPIDACSIITGKELNRRAFLHVLNISPAGSVNTGARICILSFYFQISSGINMKSHIGGAATCAVPEHTGWEQDFRSMQGIHRPARLISSDFIF